MYFNVITDVHNLQMCYRLYKIFMHVKVLRSFLYSSQKLHTDSAPPLGPQLLSHLPSKRQFHAAGGSTELE